MFWNNWFKTNQFKVEMEVSEIRALARERHRKETKNPEEIKSKARKDALQLSDEITQEIKERLKSDKEIVQYHRGAYHFYIEYWSDNPILTDKLYRKELVKNIKNYLKKEMCFKSGKSANGIKIRLGSGFYYMFLSGVKISV